MRKYVLFAVAVVFFVAGGLDFVKSGRFEGWMDNHPNIRRNSCIEYHWGFLVNLANRKQSARYRFKRVLDRYPDSQYAPLAWAELIDLMDGLDPIDRIVYEGQRFLEKYPDHPEAGRIRRKIVFLQHGY